MKKNLIPSTPLGHPTPCRNCGTIFVSYGDLYCTECISQLCMPSVLNVIVPKDLAPLKQYFKEIEAHLLSLGWSQLEVKLAMKAYLDNK